jgi:Sensors of blue-light using FAD
MPHTAEPRSSSKLPGKEFREPLEPQLFGLVYVSAVAPLLGPDTFDTDLATWRTRNALSGLTGLLLRKNGDFLQYLEGPKPALTQLFARICSDPYHRGVIETLRELIAHREFPLWPMGYFKVPRFIGADQSPAYETHGPVLDTGQASRSSAQILISSFWHDGHVRPAP